MLNFRYTNCVPGFNLPIVMRKDKTVVKFNPDEQWRRKAVSPEQAALLTPDDIQFMYYLKAVKTK
ncbi:hypothetical protein MKQ70_03505 [Chitinophaga sedimenti]|uniref:hypothetical protein n=1 Tax=Chitinophaga sedimenti TaxID=2033606 RepID=UPI0020061ACA|nr:hypothetical protein [Chitinophaga sedimenti]MCK7554125.1 hypothetical protein [Chitinophaga sedimenti]